MKATIKVEVRGKKYHFPLKVKGQDRNRARGVAESACRGITYRIDVRGDE
jgi:hypothetical protein